MNDSPIQTVLQQRDARPVSGEHLEVLGKKAAADWVMGKYASLNEAIVNTVRSERLSPEQVCRVVEFTNGDAYLQEFRKEGSHKVVHFDCGPADPSQVLQDLNDGGGGSVYDRGTLDFSMHPSTAKHAAAYRAEESMDKTAAAEEPGVPGLPKLTKLPELPKHAHYEDQMWGLFGNGKPAPMTFAEPLRPLIDLNHKLAGACDELSSNIDLLELDYAEAGDRLYSQVKQAALEGTTLGDIVNAWATVTSDPVYVKVAFQVMTPRFQRERVFPSLESIGESLTKKASVGNVNPEHLLVTTYADFVDTLNKLASTRAARDELARGVERTSYLLKQGGGVLGAVGKAVKGTSRVIDEVSKPIAHVLVGPEGAKKLAPHLATATKGTALLGAGLAANAGVQSVTDRPAVQGATRAVKSIVPGTAEYQNRRYRNMTGQ